MLNTKNLIKAAVVATLSAANLACVLLAPYYAIPCAIAGLWIMAFAASMDLHLFTPATPAVNIEQAAAVNVAPRPPSTPVTVTTGDTLRVPRSTTGMSDALRPRRAPSLSLSEIHHPSSSSDTPQ